MPKEKRKHRHYSRSRSRSSSPVDRRRRREERLREKAEERRQMKALETPEEKRQRRLAKKELKEKRRREKMGWDKEMMGYSNADNPFGDEHLTDRFVWHKKRENEGVYENELTKKELKRREEKEHEELRRELDKVKRRRIEREREKEAREEEMTLLQRMKESENFKEWESQEDKFHLEQAMLRSKIRIESGRAKPIDLLAKYINTSEEDVDIEMQEPYHLLRGLNVLDLEDLLEDIKVYLELEKDIHYDYWHDMIVVCEDELQKLRKLEQVDKDPGRADRRGGINNAVATDVTSVFKGKTYGQLIVLEQQIDKRINSGDAVDMGYWESLLQQLKAHMARARLRDKHQAILRKKLFQLKQEQAEEFGIAGTPLFPVTEAGPSSAVKEEEEVSEKLKENEEDKTEPQEE